MQCNENGDAWCVNKNRQEWEAWKIIHPENTSIMTSSHLCAISLTTTGAIITPLLGLAAGALVPVAMSTFGTVVAGVGTFHAPLAAGGCAAILQVSPATLHTGRAAAAGAFAGAMLSSFITKSKQIGFVLVVKQIPVVDNISLHLAKLAKFSFLLGRIHIHVPLQG
jgi:hypothetical protein